MFRPVNDDIVSYDEIINRIMDCYEQNNESYTYRYGLTNNQREL